MQLLKNHMQDVVWGFFSALFILPNMLSSWFVTLTPYK